MSDNKENPKKGIQINPTNQTYLAVGILFFIIGVTGQPAFIALGIVFMVLGMTQNSTGPAEKPLKPDTPEEPEEPTKPEQNS